MISLALRLPVVFASLASLATSLARRDESSAIEDKTVAELAEDAAGGDRDSFTELYRRYRGAANAVALSYVPQDAAGDVVQEAFARALYKLSSLRDPSRFGGWLMTIARNAALDAVKLRSRHRDGDAGLDQLSRRDPPRAEAARVLGVIRDLPATYREPLIMRLVEGMSGAEIAERTGLTPGSVRVNLHRGMMLLRDRLGVEK